MIPAIEINNLHLAMSGNSILQDISLKVDSGAFVSIIGPNGAGKTSLIKCLSRIYDNWKGKVRIDGEDILDISQRRLAKRISYVPQAEGRRLPFTVREFILMARYPHLSPFSSISTEDKTAVDEAMAVAGVESFTDRHLDTLSGGERQMVFIAAAMAQGANTMLLDEPTSFLDYRHQIDVSRLLHRLNKENGITILSINHDINAACAHSDRIVALKNGHLYFDGPPSRILEGNTLDELYEVTFQRIPHSKNRLPIVTAGGPR